MQVLGAEGAHAAADESAKALHRALVDMGAAERERALPGRFHNHLRLVRLGRPRRDMRGDERAGADGCVGKAVGDQALIGGDDGIAPEAGLPGQRPRWRQRLTGLDEAGDDHLAQRLIEPVRGGGAGRDVWADEVERQLGPGR